MKLLKQSPSSVSFISIHLTDFPHWWQWDICNAIMMRCINHKQIISWARRDVRDHLANPWFCTIQIIPFPDLHAPESFHSFVRSERSLSIYRLLSPRLDSEAAVLNTMPSLTSRCLEIWEETDVHTAMI